MNEAGGWMDVVVNSGDYVQAVCDRNLAENITRVLYPNDNVCHWLRTHCIYNVSSNCHKSY